MASNKQQTTNPVAPEFLARLCDPFHRSMCYIAIFLLAFILAFGAAGFDIHLMAKRSAVINTLKMSDSPWVTQIFLVQVALSVVSICVVASRYVASGEKLNYILREVTDLSCQTAVITGGCGGIGKEIALQMLKWKCKVVVLGRDKTKGANTIEHLRKEAKVNFDMIQYVEMDLNDLKSVKRAAEEIVKNNASIDFLINNAGIAGDIYVNAYKRESMFATNFLGHFYFTKLLLPTLIRDKARIINVSSIAHYHYDPVDDPILKTGKTLGLMKRKTPAAYYGRSKLYNIWHTQALQRRFDKLPEEQKGVVCLSCAPGIVETPLLASYALNSVPALVASILRLFTKSPKDGANTALYLCSAPLEELVPGAYYYECKLGYVSKHAQDIEKQEALYAIADNISSN